MHRLLAIAIAAAVAALAVVAGPAFADDCSPEGAAASLRAPVAVAAGHGLVLANAYLDESTSGSLTDGTTDLFSLPAAGAPVDVALTAKGFKTLSPTLLTRPDGGLDVVQWRHGAAGDDLVATPLSGGVAGADRLLVPGIAFPGYQGVAAAEGQDGTITVVYGIPSSAPPDGAAIALRRIAPDGTLGPVTTVPGVGGSVAPRVTADAQDTVYAVVPGADGGVAIRWPVTGDPLVVRGRELAERALGDVAEGLVADGHGGAAVVAWSARADRRVATVVQSAALDGSLSATRRLSTGARSEHAASVAVDPRTGASAALVVRTQHGAPPALVLQRPGWAAVVLRRRRGYEQSQASLAIGAGGRAWAVWEEASDAVESDCNEFPLHEAVRWASLAPGARRAVSHVLAGAPVISVFE